jgi:DNA-binding GntR family transcriptional regulator
METRELVPHVLRALALAQRDDRRISLDDLVEELKVRRTDVRKVLSSLHSEGMLDILRMRLTLQGFALGIACVNANLKPLRIPRSASRAVA